jgi:DNA-binding CsgD family transcriptional regulator
MSPCRDDQISTANDTNRTPSAAGGGRPPLTRREREILSQLAEGLSGAQIAEKLVLSPETVRTHVRNAMAKLGASTRSQAVALALQQRQITSDGDTAPAATQAAGQPAAAAEPTAALERMLEGLVGLYDVDGGAIYLADEDGLSLRRLAAEAAAYGELPENVALGDGPLGRAALERRAQLLQGSGGSGRGAVIAAPMIGRGRLLGVIALVARISRPVGRSELLLLQAFASRVGEILVGGGDVDQRLDRAMERFRASWSTAPRLG